MADIAAGVADLALETMLDNNILEKIPVFGWVIKGYGVVSTVRDRLFLKKVAKFLLGTQDISEEDKNRFREKFLTNPKLCRKVGEELVLLLDRQDNFDKAFILGKVFSSYIKGTIDYDTFLRIAAAIDKAFIGDLNNLELYYSKINSYDSKQGKHFSDFLDDKICQSLYNAGLVYREGYSEDTYLPNELGLFLIQHLKT